jgi:tRNA(Ile)-lysidine synthase TilS/MesJ
MAELTKEDVCINRINKRFGKGVIQYGLIEDGDKILVGLSGGKDSLALVELLGKRARIFKPRFSVIAVHVVMKNIPYQSDLEYLKSHAAAYDVPLIVFETSFDPTTDTRKSPCFLCSWNRRKALFTVAKENGCNKIALGHHMDDILETLLMNMTYQGALVRCLLNWL